MITNSRIAVGDQLGAQMTTYANLLYLARINRQDLVFWEELRFFRRGYQFMDVFQISDERIYRANLFNKYLSKAYCRLFCKKTYKWKKEFKRIYGSKIMLWLDNAFLRWVQLSHREWRPLNRYKNDVDVDRRLKRLGNGNYDIQSGFATYSCWKAVSDEIYNEFQFKSKYQRAGDEIWSSFRIPENKETVGVHLRRTDYLLISSLCLSEAYYKKGLSFFTPGDICLIVFSDDIDECKKMSLWDGFEVVFVKPNSAAIDMYLMTKCDHMIVANSSFSFWGAFLKKDRTGKVVCPQKYIGDSSPENVYLNGNWYPSDWIALDIV